MKVLIAGSHGYISYYVTDIFRKTILTCLYKYRGNVGKSNMRNVFSFSDEYERYLGLIIHYSLNVILYFVHNKKIHICQNFLQKK